MEDNYECPTAWGRFCLGEDSVFHVPIQNLALKLLYRILFFEKQVLELTDTEEMDFTTAPCEWTERDAEIVADYEIINELGLKNVKTLGIQ